MKPVDAPVLPSTPDASACVASDDLAGALSSALERASLLEWKLEQVTLREKDLWLRLEAERNGLASAQQRVVDLSARVHEAEMALADAHRANAALTARLADAEQHRADSARSAEPETVAVARAWRAAEQRATQKEAELREARARLEVLEHAQVRFHARLYEWQRQTATEQPDLDLAELIAELRAEVLRLTHANQRLRAQRAPDREPAETDEAAGSTVDAGSDPRSAAPPSTAPVVATSAVAIAAVSTPVRSARYCPGSAAAERLWSPDPEARRQAAEALLRLNSPIGRQAVLTALATASAPDELVFLLTRLARNGGIDSSVDLSRFLEHSDAAVRAAAVDAVELGPVLDRACQDIDPFVRRRALIRLSNLDAQSARTTLTQALKDADPGVRRTACAALARQARGAEVSALLAAADDPDAGVRAAAIRALPLELRRQLATVVVADPNQRRAALSAIRAQRRARGALETSQNAR